MIRSHSEDTKTFKMAAIVRSRSRRGFLLWDFRSFSNDKNEFARFIGERLFLTWYFAEIQVCFWWDLLLKGQQRLTRHREDNNVTTTFFTLNMEIKFQNKKKNSNRPTESNFFCHDIGNTNFFFFGLTYFTPHIHFVSKPNKQSEIALL